MASIVFGNPITVSTLERMPKYVGKQITRKDRAHVVLNMKNADLNDVNAGGYVENLKRGAGSTLCGVFNATGNTVTFHAIHNYSGTLAPGSLPIKIENYQQRKFEHDRVGEAPAGSCAAVVYRGKNNDEIDCDWMLAWSNPWKKESNRAYTEIREAGHYDKDDVWPIIYGKLMSSDLNCTDEWNGCFSKVSIGDDAAPKFEAIMMLTK